MTRQDALNKLVEVLADRDDALLEKVLEDVKPTTSEIYDDLRKDLAAGAVVRSAAGFSGECRWCASAVEGAAS